MQDKYNLINKKINNLLVIKYNGLSNRLQRLWLCKCDCGNEIILDSYTLKSGHTKSCGCLRKNISKIIGKSNKGKFKKSFNEVSINRIFRNYKRAAKKRNYSFNLSKEYFVDLLLKNCYYCDNPPNNSSKEKYSDKIFKYSGIDRLDNTKGYEIDNVVPCCGTCNKMKSDLSYVEFGNIITNIYNNRYSK